MGQGVTAGCSELACVPLGADSAGMLSTAQRISSTVVIPRCAAILRRSSRCSGVTLSVIVVLSVLGRESFAMWESLV